MPRRSMTSRRRRIFLIGAAACDIELPSFHVFDSAGTQVAEAVDGVFAGSFLSVGAGPFLEREDAVGAPLADVEPGRVLVVDGFVVMVVEPIIDEGDALGDVFGGATAEGHAGLFELLEERGGVLAGAGDGGVAISGIDPPLEGLDAVEFFQSQNLGGVGEQAESEGFLAVAGLPVGFLAAGFAPLLGVADTFYVFVGLGPLAVDPRPAARVDADPEHEPVLVPGGVAKEVDGAVFGDLVGLDDMHTLAEPRERGGGGLGGDAVGAAEDFFAGLLGELDLHALVTGPRVRLRVEVKNGGVAGGALLERGDGLEAFAVALGQQLGLDLSQGLGALEVFLHGRAVAFHRREGDDEDAVAGDEAVADRLQPVEGH